METICLRCGDKGFSNALVFCVKCLDVAVHRYCLDEVTYDGFVHWICDDCEAKEPNELTIRNSDAVPPESCTNYDAVEEQAKPVIDPIWRGEFNIWNEEYKLFCGLVAHLSFKACQRVSEEAKLFPLLLHFEMLPKSDLWPKRFKMSGPSDDDIALYFFPSEARHEQDFDHLVNVMIGGELSLQAFMPNAELLVFTSTELPLLHRRNWLAGFQQKFYLWGVLRPRQGGSSSCQMVKSVIRQTPGNMLAAKDPINLVKAITWHAESPLSNSASVVNTNDDVEDNLAATVVKHSTPSRKSERVTIPPRRLANFVYSPSDLSVAGSRGFLGYQQMKKGFFSSTEESDV